MRIKKEASRASSGIKNFDSLISGGFQRESANLVLGGSGTGKTIFGIHFLIEGVKNKEPCLFISFEERKIPFYNNMKKIGIDLETMEKQKKFFFLEYTPQKVKIMLEEGGGAIEGIILQNKIKRVVIDCLSSLLLLFSNNLEKRDAVLSLFNLLKGWNCTSIITSREEYSLDRNFLGIVDSATDSVINLSLKAENNQKNRFLEIIKMRGANHSLNIHEFKIEKKGIVISGKNK